MDPLTLVAVAVALGASDGAKETAKAAVVDSYGALKRYLQQHYDSVSPEVEGLEAEPDEGLRRQLLAKKLSAAGASEDETLEDLAKDVVGHVADDAPETAHSVGVRLTRVSAMGDIVIEEVHVDGGSGVVTQDVATDGSIRISGVSSTGSAMSGDRRRGGPAAGDSSFTSSQQGVQVGRDNIAYFSYGASDSGSNSGRVRAVTASVERIPVGDGLWTVTIHNGTRGPITEVEVDVYAVDESGTRLDTPCVPAKNKLPFAQLFRQLLTPTLEGTLDSYGQGAMSIPGMASQMPPGGLGSYGGMIASHITSSPQMHGLEQQVRAAMPDSFPKVLTAEQSAAVVYMFDGRGSLRADFTFADEDGNTWSRPFGDVPRRLR